MRRPVKRLSQIMMAKVESTAASAIPFTRAGRPVPGALQWLRSEIRTQPPRFRTGKVGSFK
jgi:hypothetical protein